ncbi:ankyrin repeat-containing protein [Aspergillus arachidicola]|uniref:Ankyrin repeat-containing protein n=1 Tax=Aspergillus arachidicola TaxID=656916 RepID=A0A2G7G5S6_9EURO|nr:ankyrin repeat-containing protein [Aspergillus arachidicola]
MHLLLLPNELLQLVAENLSTDADLYALIQTHSRFYHLLETYRFEHNVRYGEGSALVWAAAHGHIEIAKKSLRAKADANALSRLHRSIFKLNLCTCPSIILPADHAREYCPDGRHRSTPIMLAAMNGHKEIVELLVHHGADINRQVGGVCYPVLGAIAYGNVDIVEYLLITGVDLDVALDGFWDYNPLELAAHEGHAEVVKLLLRYGVDPNKSSALALATSLGKLEAARVLLEAGANIERICTRNQMDALFNAVDRGNATVVSLLIEYGANLERRDNDGMTPLAYAAYFRRPEAAEVLLNHGAKVNALSQGLTALSWAIDEGKVPMVKLLLENGADLTITNEPLLLRILKSNRIHNQEADAAIVELLLNHGADPNCCDRKGRTPLLLATVKQKLGIMRVLLVHGANPNREDEELDLLSWAFLKGHENMVNMLLAYGACESWLRGDHIMTR